LLAIAGFFCLIYFVDYHMNKSDFHISKLDCPSEEQLIRIKLMELIDVKKLFSQGNLRGTVK